MRGNLIGTANVRYALRSIPAYAGEPKPAVILSGLSQVYPRVCGGTTAWVDNTLNFRGLSPRMRGNQLAGSAPAAWRRSIPAYAGEPWGQKGIPRIGGVYPRVCGGTKRGPDAGCGDVGLSPRMRGNLVNFLAGVGRQRSIPAYAGEPTEIETRLAGLKVYPRVCGGTPAGVSQMATAGGLSPRMRGNQSFRRSYHHHPRSIPAYAGEPLNRWLPLDGRPVYPRVCGGTVPTAVAPLL